MKRVPVVVTGVGVICPLGRNAEEFWTNLTQGRAAVGRATQASFAGMDDVWVGEVPDAWVEQGLPDGACPGDRFTALALVAAREALRHSGLDGAALAGVPTGLVVGQCQPTADDDGDSPFLPFHEAADNVARQWGLAGPRVVISTACAAGANAVGAGRDLLWDGQADVVLAGGTDNLQKGTHLGFSLLQAVSIGAPTAPYSLSQGLSLGEGAAFLVLETAEHAAARGARVLAEVGGYGLSADAYHATAPDPTGKGPLRAVRRALDDAGLAVQDIAYVNGHGTGTPTNDRMERTAMRSLFGDRLAQVPISSTKSGIGHTLGASGAIEAVTCVLAIEHQTAPPTVNFVGPGHQGFDFVPHVGRPMPIDVALSNNYAFGGNNCSVVLTRPGRLPEREPEVAGDDVLITGLGVVSGYGAGLDAWREGVRSGRSAIGEVTGFDARAHGCGYGVESFPLGRKPLAAAGLWRHLADYGRAALAATTLALSDAGIRTHGPGREDIGLVFATTYGPVATAVELAQGMNSPGGASALSFANATVNAAAGAVCQGLVLRGPTTTIASGGASALVALDVSVNLIRTGHARRVVLLAIDEFCEAVLAERAKHDPLAADGVLQPYDRARHGTVLGAAAVAILLEPASVVRERQGRGYARLLGTAHTGVVGSAPDAEQITARDTLRALLRRTGVDPAGIGLVAGSGCGAQRDVHELRALGEVLPPGALLTAPKSLTGECEAASGGINLLTAALAVHEGLIPATANLSDPLPDAGLTHVTSPLESSVDVALATAGSPGSVYATALLGRA